MTCKNSQNLEFTRKFTLEEFKSLDEKFYNIKTPIEAIDFFDNTIRQEKVGVNEDNSKVTITLYLNQQGLYHQIEIPLDKNGGATGNNILSVNNNTNYGSTNNLDNIFNNTENTNFNQFLGFGTQNTDSNNTKYDNLGGYMTNNTNFGLEDLGAQSVPLPSSNSNQYINSDTTPIIPTQTLPSIDTTTQYTTQTNTFDINEFVKVSPNIVPPVINDLMRPSFNRKTSPSNFVIRSPQVQTTNSKIDFEIEKRRSIFTSPVTFSLPRRYKKLLELDNKPESEIHPQPSLVLNTLNSQPQPGIDLFSNQPQTNFDYNTFQTSEQKYNYDSYQSPLQPTTDYGSYQYQAQPKVESYHTQQNIEYNTFQSQPQPQVNHTTYQPQPQVSHAIYQPQPQVNHTTYQPQPQVSHAIYQPQPQVNHTTYHTQQQTKNTTYQPQPLQKIDLNRYQSPPLVKTERSTQTFEQKIFSKPASLRPSLAQKMNPTEQYKFGITLFKSPDNTAKIEKITEVTRKTETKIVNDNDDKIKSLEGDTNSLRTGHQKLKDKLNELTNEINFYKNQIGNLERDKSNNELDALRDENRAIKQQLSELNKLRDSSAEINYLRNQLSELDPLRRKAAEMDSIKDQLRELNDLRARVNELSSVRSQLDELNRLKNQINQMNNMKNQLGELDDLKRRIAEAENYRKQVEQMEAQRNQYEQDIQNLRNSQRIEMLKFKKMSNSKYDSSSSRQLLFDERINNITVKGDIIRNMDELEMITRKINKKNNKIILNLIYKATADSDKASAFHEKCDDARSTLVLVETNKGKRFGGFTTCTWRGDCVEKKDNEAFIFSLDKMMTYDIISGEDAIGCYPKFGPIFLGCQIRIYDDAFSKGGTTYEKGLNYNTEEDYELTGGDRIFLVKEIEVYEVINQ